MYGYGYGGGFGGGPAPPRSPRETDYMDVKHPWFDVLAMRRAQLGLAEMNDDGEADVVSLEKRLSKFSKTQDQDKSIQEQQTLAEAPVLHSEAINLQMRDQGYKSSMEGSKTAVLGESTFDELSAQLDIQYDYKQCSDCKVQSKFVCIQCHDAFCAVCYASNHRRGKRQTHQRISLELYQYQRKNGVAHYAIPDELPPLLDPNEVNQGQSNNAIMMNYDDEGYIDANDLPGIATQNSAKGFMSIATSFFKGIFATNASDHAAMPIQYDRATIDAQVMYTTQADLERENARQRVLAEKSDDPNLPYRELPDDPSNLDGWWRGTPRHWLRGRAKYIPLRLTHEERYHLRLLIAVLNSCDYIGRVDHSCVSGNSTNIKKRNVNMISSIMAILTALLAAKSPGAAREQNLSKYKDYLEAILEIGVRHYLRSQKQTGWIQVLLCLLQDLQLKQVSDVIGCKITINIRTVHTILYPRNMLYVLDSNLMYQSTEPICVDTKTDLAKRISARKSKAIKLLTTSYAKQSHDWADVFVGEISEQNLLLCLYSIGDHNLNLHFTRDVCTRIGRILCGLYRWDHEYFIGVNRCVDTALINSKDNATYEDIAKSITVDLDSLLRLEDGKPMPTLMDDEAEITKKYGSEYDTSSVYNNDLEYMVHQCLSTQNKRYTESDKYKEALVQAPMFRTHAQHLQHVLQTISLWETITHYLPFISYLSVVSFLSVENNMYTLCNNGQGIVRVQPAVLLQRVMVALVVCALRGVGSGAIHVGDSSVPNALALIDKYLQLNSILTPLLSTARYWWNTTVQKSTDEQLKNQRLTTFTAKCIQHGHRKMLQHWSIHGMDGSGGETVFESGSCVDARLTSVWNWCNILPNQDFYPLFLLAGFTSFDQLQWD